MAVDVKAALTRKIGPLPVVAWGGVVGGGILLWRAARGGGGAESPFVQPIAGGTPIDFGDGEFVAGGSGIGGSPGIVGGSCGAVPTGALPPGVAYICQNGAWAVTGFLNSVNIGILDVPTFQAIIDATTPTPTAPVGGTIGRGFQPSGSITRPDDSYSGPMPNTKPTLIARPGAAPTP